MAVQGVKPTEDTATPRQVHYLRDQDATMKVNFVISALSAGAVMGSIVMPGLGTLFGSIVAGFLGWMVQEHLRRTRQHSDKKN